MSPSKLSPFKQLSPPKAGREAGLSHCIASGLYERVSGTYTSYFLVEANSQFRIEWHDDHDGTWLRGKGELHNVTVTAEEYDDEDGTVLTWDIILRGEFVVGAPEAASLADEVAAADDSGGIGLGDGALEALLKRVADLARARPTSGGSNSSPRGGKSKRRSKAVHGPILRHEFEGQDYLWTFQVRTHAHAAVQCA